MTESPIFTTRIPASLHNVMEGLAKAAISLSGLIRQGDCGRRAWGHEVAANTDIDPPQGMGVCADDLFAAAMRDAGVRWYVSDNQPEALALNDSGCLAVAIDPLNGAASLDTNVPVGSIFSVVCAAPNADSTFLAQGARQLAGGYVIYGPRTSLVVTFGDGTQVYTLNPEANRFELTSGRIEMPRESGEFAIDASNYRHWAQPVRAYVDDCLAGTEGPRQKNFNMRWSASLVAETHRILKRGGIFLYPADRRSGHENGRLRLLYECAPIAFLIEQAGGRATDGSEPILRGPASDLHQRTPLVFGSVDMVDRVTAYHDLPDTEVSALFGNRGLFRA